jgi:hypothetical protein
VYENNINVSDGDDLGSYNLYNEFDIINEFYSNKMDVDIKQLGYDITAFVGIYLEKSSLYDAVAKELMNIPEIVRLNYITGNYSMFAEIVCKDITQLRFVLHDQLQKIKGINIKGELKQKIDIERSKLKKAKLTESVNAQVQLLEIDDKTKKLSIKKNIRKEIIQYYFVKMSCCNSRYNSGTRKNIRKRISFFTFLSDYGKNPFNQFIFTADIPAAMQLNMVLLYLWNKKIIFQYPFPVYFILWSFNFQKIKK